MTTLVLTLPANQSISNPLEIPHGIRLVRIGMPSDWTAAPITFLISADNIDWRALYHASQTPSGGWSPYEATLLQVIPGSILLLPGTSFGGDVVWLKFRSGTSSRPVNQAADRSFTLLFT